MFPSDLRGPGGPSPKLSGLTDLTTRTMLSMDLSSASGKLSTSAKGQLLNYTAWPEIEIFFYGTSMRCKCKTLQYIYVRQKWGTVTHVMHDMKIMK